MDSPRSLEACRQLGILPEELYYQDFDAYIRMNPEVVGLPKEIQKIRFENIDKYRKETIEMVKNQRELIINDKDKKEDRQITDGSTYTHHSSGTHHVYRYPDSGCGARTQVS